jgi:pimeloyl-ACP methyl ester carboxylesterase
MKLKKYLQRRSNVFLTLTMFMIFCFSSTANSADIDLKKQEINGVEIAWAELGDPNGPPLLLIQGLMVSSRIWGDDLLDGLVADGHRVIVFDNRDVGDSQRMDHLGEPIVWWNILKSKVGLPVTAPYSLYDMADDAVGVLDALEIEQAHVLGASMGGMIAQIVAAKNPDRVRSLISVMSTTGAPHLPPPSGESSGVIEDLLNSDEARRVELNARGVFPSALPRQFFAISTTGDRTELVKTIKAKTLVLHGEDDALIPMAHGQYTAEVINDATFVSFKGMAHNLPKPTIPLFLDAVDTHISSVESARSDS